MSEHKAEMVQLDRDNLEADRRINAARMRTATNGDG